MTDKLSVGKRQMKTKSKVPATALLTVFVHCPKLPPYTLHQIMIIYLLKIAMSETLEEIEIENNNDTNMYKLVTVLFFLLFCS
jgi:hypothetical protein